jgi:predicted amidohydrolase
MSTTVRVGCIQNCATDDVQGNIEECVRLARAAHAAGAAFVLLPEHCAALQPADRLTVARAYVEESHPALAAFRALAGELDLWILVGSLAIRITPERINNRSYLIGADGGIRARYDKVHLFDVQLRSGEVYRESATVEAGRRAVIADTPWAKLGMSVCYDIRFAYLYRQLAQAGAALIAIPAAFTHPTGAAHWHVLVRARAIETGAYVLAPAQCGIRPWGRRTYGHSLIVDPWGTVLADAGEEPGYIVSDLDLDQVERARAMVPALHHDRVLPDL